MKAEEIFDRMEYLKGILPGLERERDALRRVSTEVRSQSMNGVPHSTNRPSEAYYTRIVDCIDLKEREIQEAREELNVLRLRVALAMEQMANGHERDVLSLHYIEGKSWQQIADELGYSRWWVYSTRKTALLNFEAALSVAG